MNAVPEVSWASAGPRVVIVGAGPAGLMAAEALLAAGAHVDVYDTMPSAGRKFLLAGKGGLNLTHSEPAESFRARYGARADAVGRWLDGLDAQGLRDWAAGLGIDTFVGSSGKVFPAGMKAAPLLRGWLHRLRAGGVKLHMRHRWNGRLERDGDDPGWRLGFDTPAGATSVAADGVMLALGGASWPRLGSDGAWQPWLRAAGVDVAPLVSANCGFEVAWSEHLRGKFAGEPLKGVRLAHVDRQGRRFDRAGEAVVSAYGLEGALVYAASAQLRNDIAAGGPTTVHLDLQPQRSQDELRLALARGRGARSWTNHLREHAGLHGVKAALLREGLDAAAWAALLADPAAQAARIKALPIVLNAPRPVEEAISSAGGVRLDGPQGLDERLMLRALPGVFCAGEMLDWEAPTGGYLLTACFASGRVAGEGLSAWWAQQQQQQPSGTTAAP
jgi:hypothetical protein